MGCKRIRTGVVAALGFATVASADQRLWLAGVYADPSLAAPVVELVEERTERSRFRFGVAAWTLSAEWERLQPDRRSRFLTIEAAPRNADAGERVYREGARAPELEFDGHAAELRAGWRGARGERWGWELAAVVQSKSIESGERELRDRWRDPYAGASGGLRFRRVAADEPLSGRIEGLELTGTARLMGGEESYARLVVALRAGQRHGALHFGQTVTVVAGGALDRVNAVLVGGSWDSGGATTLYGFRYAEFRLERKGALVAMRMDLDAGDGWSLGLRGSLLAGDSQRAAGAGAVVERSFRGVVAAGGVFVGEQRGAARCCDPIYAVSVGSALFSSRRNWF